jgi:chaperonin cofactor prefoldin
LEEVEITQLRRLYETLQMEIIDVLESLGRLRKSPDYEICRIHEQKPGVLDELTTERARLLDKESATLEKQANRLADEIKELGGEKATPIS